jgi:hypothetical protein
MATATPPNRPGKSRGTAQGQGGPPTGPQDVTRRLDGLRGWLAEIDRSLRRRSVLALVLTALAIGAGAAAIYISLTKNAESDRIDALETRIENLEAAAGTTAPDETVPDDQTDTGTGIVPETTSPESDGLGSDGAPDSGVGDDGASGGALP